MTSTMRNPWQCRVTRWLWWWFTTSKRESMCQSCPAYRRCERKGSGPKETSAGCKPLRTKSSNRSDPTITWRSASCLPVSSTTTHIISSMWSVESSEITILCLFCNFSAFSYAAHAISIRLGGTIPVEQCRQYMSPKNDPHHWKYICIEGNSASACL